MKLKLAFLVLPLIFGMYQQMQASEGAWPKLVDNTFAVTNTGTGLLILQHLRNPELGDATYASKAFLGYVIPCFLLNKYKENINKTPGSHTAEKLQVGISAAWCAYTMYKVLNPPVRPQAITGQPVSSGYPSSGQYRQQ